MEAVMASGGMVVEAFRATSIKLNSNKGGGHDEVIQEEKLHGQEGQVTGQGHRVRHGGDRGGRNGTRFVYGAYH